MDTTTTTMNTTTTTTTTVYPDNYNITIICTPPPPGCNFPPPFCQPDCKILELTPPPPPPTIISNSNHHHLSLPILLTICFASAFCFLSLSLVALLLFRRWLNRTSNTLNPHQPEPDNDGPNFDENGVVHHVWYIRTAGLDEATIASIASADYKSGGLLGAADCAVCLGEFGDGDRVRLLPRCGHVFHAPCIDTWLRAHVNCPLCRSLVVDPTAAAAGSSSSAASESDIEQGEVDDVEESQEMVVDEHEVLDEIPQPEELHLEITEDLRKPSVC